MQLKCPYMRVLHINNFASPNVENTQPTRHTNILQLHRAAFAASGRSSYRPTQTLLPGRTL